MSSFVFRIVIGSTFLGLPNSDWRLIELPLLFSLQIRPTLHSGNGSDAPGEEEEAPVGQDKRLNNAN